MRVYIPKGRAGILFLEKPGQQSVVWDCSLALCKYLEKHPDIVACKRVVELGCGIGLPGFVSASLGASSVLLTEMSAEALTAANDTLHRNKKEQLCVKTTVLDWFACARGDISSVKDANVALCSDLIYGGDKTTIALAATLDALLLQ